ncbi:PREDICTED: E3 ubiquitin-protein ligase RNF125 [Gekko japonicus]|uniref:RING-type E3 ubiquitin transferase n=1 Tax=Gekko japonicus TaxID=146911 RepID=A0ABM1K8K2_GEKJA|nr:PREDICTED: E3 ubiquitin-protein ligase RNF125 [Gekko japonicus]
MGSVWSSEDREVVSGPDARGQLQGIQFPRAGGEETRWPIPSFDCSICLEVLHQPVRTRCGHIFCHSCIATSLRNNTWTCPYCRAYLHSEGIPATDVTKMMENIYQNCTECDTEVCLNEMRAHLRTCAQYIEKYGPLQEVQHPVTRYPCPSCQYELDENDLLDHYLTYHRFERRTVYCPVCRLLPDGGPSYYSSGFIRHLQLRHALYDEDYEDYIVNIEEALIESVLDESFLEYVHVNNPNTA